MLWREAPFGYFCLGAQIITDRFLAAGTGKPLSLEMWHRSTPYRFAPPEQSRILPFVKTVESLIVPGGRNGREWHRSTPKNLGKYAYQQIFSR